jgi:carboxylesterase
VAGLIAYVPSLKLTDKRRFIAPLLKHLVPSVPKPADFYVDPEAHTRLWAYPVYPSHAAHELIQLIHATRRLLPQVSCPTLIIDSAGDPSVKPESGLLLYREIGSQDKQLVTLHHSGHVITIDQEWERVAELTYTFIRQRIAADPPV